MEKCIICEGMQKHGIHLYTSFICTECEQEMIATSTADVKYRFYIEQLRVVNETKMTS